MSELLSVYISVLLHVDIKTTSFTPSIFFISDNARGIESLPNASFSLILIGADLWLTPKTFIAIIFNVYLLYILRKYRYVIYYTIMSNYLNILLIIIPLFVSSCSNNRDEVSSVNMPVSQKNFSGDKYSHLYNSLYISLALKKSLNDEALRTFINNIDTMDDINLFEKLSKISRDTHRFNYSQAISDRWIEIDGNSYLAYMYALSASIDNSNFDKANEYFTNFIRVSDPRDRRDYAKLIFFIIENKNRINVVRFFEEYLKKNNNYALHINFIELLYSYNMH